MCSPARIAVSWPRCFCRTSDALRTRRHFHLLISRSSRPQNRALRISGSPGLQISGLRSPDLGFFTLTERHHPIHLRAVSGRGRSFRDPQKQDVFCGSPQGGVHGVPETSDPDPRLPLPEEALSSGCPFRLEGHTRDPTAEYMTALPTREQLTLLICNRPARECMHCECPPART